eukprot:13196409-Alexandrium_andersonii.AAC.1
MPPFTLGSVASVRRRLATRPWSSSPAGGDWARSALAVGAPVLLAGPRAAGPPDPPLGPPPDEPPPPVPSAIP